MSNAVKLYSMELHETVSYRYGLITRVPGGWLYQSYGSAQDDDDSSLTSVFVPFNTEFEPGGT